MFDRHNTLNLIFFLRSKPKNAYEMEVCTVDEDKKEKVVVPVQFISKNEEALHI